MGAKTDRRVKYTKTAIKNSFIQLLKQKPISKITIKELCEAADVNRATFYAHYADQYDLLAQIERDIIEDVNRSLQSYDYSDIRSIPVEMIEKIILYIEENTELFELLLGDGGDMKFQQEVIGIIGRRNFIPMMDSEAQNSGEAEYVFHFLASGAMGVIQMWLKSGRKKSAKEIANLILKISTSGRASFGA